MVINDTDVEGCLRAAPRPVVPSPVSNGALQLQGFKPAWPAENRTQTRPRERDGGRWTDGSRALVKPRSSERSWAKLQPLGGIKPNPATWALPSPL